MSTFGNSDFTNDILFSPGIEYSVWNPVKWFYLQIALQGCIGHDTWKCDIVNDKVSGIVYGATAGATFEFFPVPYLSIVAKAQEYLIFGNNDQYIKPNFSLGLRYNFHF